MSIEEGLRRATALFKQTHWGIEATHRFDVDDPDLPTDPMTEMGKVLEMGFETEDTEGFVQFGAGNILCFHPGDSRRLFVVCTDHQMRYNQEHIWQEDGDVYELREAFSEVGGRQAKFMRKPAVPKIEVQIIGDLSYVIYRTPKEGDLEDGEPAMYDHEFEDPQPLLCIDNRGRLWVAGGGYTVKEHGIIG